METGDPADRQTSHDTSVTKQMTDDSTSVRDVKIAGWGRGGGFFSESSGFFSRCYVIIRSPV